MERWWKFFAKVLPHELRLLGFIALAVFLLWTTGLPLTVLLWVGGLCYLFYHTYQFKCLLEWIHIDPPVAPPDTVRGIWTLVATRFHQRQRGYRASEASSRQLIDQFLQVSIALPDAIVIINERGQIEWLNDQANKLMGLRRQDRGSLITNLIRDPAFVNFFNDGLGEQNSLRLTSPLGEHIKLDIRLVSYREKLLLIAQDVSQLQHMEKIRQDFVANVSHELRTPLSVIAGYLEMLRDDNSAELKPHQPILEKMQTQSDQMTRLVDDLLVLSNLDSLENVSPQAEVDVPGMLRAITQDANVLSAAKQQTIELDANEQLWLMGNQRELHGAFSNLVANAVNYTPENGNITIRWAEEDDTLVLSVTDTGIGIEPQHISRITERFYRADKGRSKHTGGTGLGLAIVKHTLQRHDAELQIDSQPGQGSTFRCVFPLRRGLLKHINL